MNTLQSSSKPKVLIFSDPSGFALALCEELLKSSCDVIVFSYDPETWRTRLNFLGDPTSVSILPPDVSSLVAVNANYIIYTSSAVEPTDERVEYDEAGLVQIIGELTKSLSAPTLYLFPYTMYPDLNLTAYENARKNLKDKPDLVGVLFLGDVVGERVNISDKRIFPRVFKDIVESSPVRVPKGDYDIWPISKTEAVREVIKKLFSFGGFGGSSAILSTPFKVNNLSFYLKNIASALDLSYTDDNFNYENFGDIPKDYLATELSDLLSRALPWYTPRPRPAPTIKSYEVPPVRPMVVEDAVPTPFTPPPPLEYRAGSLPINHSDIPSFLKAPSVAPHEPERPQLDYQTQETLTLRGLLADFMVSKISDWKKSQVRRAKAVKSEVSVNPPGHENVERVKQSFLESAIASGRYSAGLGLNFSKFAKPLARKTIRHRRKISFALLLLIFIVGSPFLFMGIGAVSLTHAKSRFLSGDIGGAEASVKFSQNLFAASSSELEFFASAPIVGRLFLGAENASKLSYDATQIADSGFHLLRLTSEMVEKVMGGEEKDIAYYSRQITLETDSVYKRLAFLESELDESTGPVRYFSDKLLAEYSLKDIRNKLLYSQDLIRELPEILGENGRRNYLVLFQNNMELRPTGGFIGSFAIVSFDKGKLVDITVQDVYDADGQLKGHVEPPAPIKNYLGEANWYLRDSNWDPDFAVSAQRAEWFLDKEIDQQFDGVAAIDLEFVKGLVDVYGSIKLTDFEHEITSTNLYEITQTEVEDDFFPGSRKKSTFMTALTRELLTRLTKSDKKYYYGLARVISNSLDRRHVQLFSHNINVEKAVTGLGWDGTLPTPTCTGNCFADTLSVVDANVGVNKANSFIVRKMDTEVNYTNGRLTRTLNVDFSNLKSKALGGETYSSYLRVLVPSGSEFVQVSKSDNGRLVNVAPEISDVLGRKEAGIYLQVEPQTSSRITFVWAEDLPVNKVAPLSYSLIWRKQAGTVADPISVTLKSPSLTRQGVTSYNTTLERDFVTSLDL